MVKVVDMMLIIIVVMVDWIGRRRRRAGEQNSRGCGHHYRLMILHRIMQCLLRSS